MTTSAEDQLKAFIAQSPNIKYTFESERDASHSEICRDVGNGKKDCIMLQMNSKRLFESMQNLGFFCALPLDPSRTHMECTPIPQS